MQKQPIVLLGGFLSSATSYGEMAPVLAAAAGVSVSVVHVGPGHWLLAVGKIGWGMLLRELDATVRRALRASPTGKVTLVGHSAGGVLGRLYLAPAPFLSRAYSGLDVVDCLITLGSPHYNHGGLTLGGKMSQYVERHYPGAYFAPRVRYVAVAGRFAQGDPAGSRSARWLHGTYQSMCGDGEAWGDGLVPLPSALLAGATPIVLEGVGHHSIVGGPWYGDADVVSRWWQMVAAPTTTGEEQG